MDYIRTVINAVGGPEAIGVVLAAAVAYLGRQVLTRRPQSQAVTNAAFGRRLQDMETDLHLETVRRIQIERELGARGIRMPYWPADGADGLPAPTSSDVYRGDPTDAAPRDLPDETGAVPRVSVPPLPMAANVARYARHTERKPS
jgi:hypothetical protein